MKFVTSKKTTVMFPKIFIAVVFINTMLLQSCNRKEVGFKDVNTSTEYHFGDSLMVSTGINYKLRVNGEYYVDSLMGELIELGLNVKTFEVDDYICWGTPNDYETFVYWQSFFHKVDWHPYNLKKDITVHKKMIQALDKKYRTFTQEYR
jgi:hypothetical protein